jgi:hypothetical protein
MWFLQKNGFYYKNLVAFLQAVNPSVRQQHDGALA